MKYMASLYNKFLKKTARFFGTDAQYLMEGGYWSIIARVGVSALLFVLSILYARYLTKDMYGSYRLILSVVGMGSFLLLPGIHTAFVRIAARGKLGSYRRAIRLDLLLSLLLSLWTIGAGIYFFIQGNEMISISLFAASLLLLLETGTGGYKDWLVIMKKFKEKAFAVLSENIFFGATMALAVLSIYVYEIRDATALIVLLSAFYVGHGLPKIFYLARTVKTIPKKQDSVAEKGALSYGLHLSASGVINPFARHIDKLLLFSFLGPVELAVYSFALLIPEQASGFFTAFTNIVTTKIFKKKGAELQDLPKKLLKAAGIFALLVLFYIALAPFIYNLFFPRYEDAISLSQVFSISLIPLPLTFLATALVSAKKLKRVYAYRILIPLAQIILLVIFIPLWGLWGAISAKVAGAFLAALILLVLFFKKDTASS